MSLVLNHIDFIQVTSSFIKEGKKIYKIPSTKSCPVCGNDKLLLKSSLNEKTCTDCRLHFEWKREEGQKKLYE